jgi:hypothetical protein
MAPGRTFAWCESRQEKIREGSREDESNAGGGTASVL